MILLDKDEDIFIIKDAALGLCRLKADNSADLIIKAISKERMYGDNNSYGFLKSLGEIRGKEARKVIESYSSSKDKEIRYLVLNLLTDWKN